MKRFKAYFLATLCIGLSLEAFSQVDSTEKKSRLPHKNQPDTLSTAVSDSEERSIIRSPKKAALLSAIVPGGGQIYNKKYWKLPIVYGALGAVGFLYFNNRYWYLEYRNAYLNDLDEENALSIYGLQGVSTDQLREAADQNRKNMEYAMIGLAAIYGLQIIDATVDAHLFYFDVSDDLSFQWQPRPQWTTNGRFVQGLSINFTF